MWGLLGSSPDGGLQEKTKTNKNKMICTPLHVTAKKILQPLETKILFQKRNYNLLILLWNDMYFKLIIQANPFQNQSL